MPGLFVESVQHLFGHNLEVYFNNGHAAIVDFAPFIFSSGHPDYEPYKKVDRFLQFDLNDGDLNWDDYTMIFPLEDLYVGHLIK